MSMAKIIPAENSALMKLARENGPRLIEQAIKVLVAGAVVQDAATGEPQARKPSLARRLAGAALVKVATRSVPGAIIVSGGLIAKALHDRHKARQAAAPERQR